MIINIQQLRIFTENNLSLQYNKALAGEYLKYLNQMAEEFGLENDIRVSTLSRYPEVFAMEEQPVDEPDCLLIHTDLIRKNSDLLGYS